MLLAADSSLAAAGDLVRGERSRRADARILLVAPAGSQSAAQQALDCGAVGIVERPLDAPGAASCAGRRRLLRRAPALARARGRGPRRAARRRRRHGHDHLCGGARGRSRAGLRARPGARDGRCRGGRRRRMSRCRTRCCGSRAAPWPRRPSSRPGSHTATRAAFSRPRRCPSTPISSTSAESRACSTSPWRAVCARSSTAARASASRPFPCSSERACVAIVASADARGARGARRTALLISRLGLSARFSGIVATGCRNPGAARALAAEAGLPLLATVRTDARVARARERGLAPPGAAFAALAALAGAPGA